MSENSGIHVVLVGSDDTVFRHDATSDTLERHIGYARELDRLRPGSRLTYAVLTNSPGAKRFEKNNAVFLPVRGGRIGRLVSLYRTLAALYRERSIDVISTQSIFDEAFVALIFKRIYGPPVVGQAHFDFFNSFAIKDSVGRGLAGRLRLAIGMKAITRMAAVRVVGSDIGKRILSLGLNRNVHVLPVPVTMESDPAPRREEEPCACRRSVLCVARLVPQKNLHDWLRVAAAVAEKAPDVVFDIVGDGPLRAEIEALAKKLGIAGRVRFHGFVPYNGLGRFYRAAGVFLLTSHYEGFGRVLVEAYKCGAPAVCTRITGPVDIIEHGKTGFLHEPGDIEGMAESVLKLLSDDKLRAGMAESGRRLVSEKFDPQRITRELVSLLASVAGDPADRMAPPLRATPARWRRISSSRHSLLRSLQYERLDGLALRGATLDIGGGRNVGYLHLLRLDGDYFSVNIDPKIRPTLVADLNLPLPLASGVFDNVISFNTFEHIREDAGAIREVFRVLRPGGGFHFMVPFIYCVHGSPFDFHRHTALWWKGFFLSLGLRTDGFIIEPLVWDPLASAFSLVEMRRFFHAIHKRFVLLRAVLSHARWPGLERLPEAVGRGYADFAIGYYIHGTKPLAPSRG